MYLTAKEINKIRLDQAIPSARLLACLPDGSGNTGLHLAALENKAKVLANFFSNPNHMPSFCLENLKNKAGQTPDQMNRVTKALFHDIASVRSPVVAQIAQTNSHATPAHALAPTGAYTATVYGQMVVQPDRQSKFRAG